MKKILLLAVACMAFTIAQAQQADTTIRFTKIVHDFGEIAQGAPQTYAFELVNNGTEPLIIKNVQASCGCTTPGWTREPIAPGDKGEVKATYNAAAVGRFDKTLTISSNGTPERIVLHIRGTVVAPAAPTAPENK